MKKVKLFFQCLANATLIIGVSILVLVGLTTPFTKEPLHAAPPVEKVESKSKEKIPEEKLRVLKAHIATLPKEQQVPTWNKFIDLMIALGFDVPDDVPVVVVKPPLSWTVTIDGKRINVEDKAIETLVGQFKPGTYVCIGNPDFGQQPVTRTISVVDGRGPIPPPGPEPAPAPTPQPTPTPTPEPVVDAPKSIIIFRETKTTTNEFARTISILRSGSPADYIASKKHDLKILDIDTKKGNGEQPQVIKDWIATIGGMKLPLIVMVDPATNKLVCKQELSAEAKSDEILSIIKSHGG